MSANGPSPGEWTEAAAIAIRVCEAWAAETAPHIHCHFYLFGSVVYREGEQFDPIASDLDLVCALPENGDAVSRMRSIQLLYEAKRALELKILSELQRTSCTEPAVSLVVATPLEIETNVHKSATRTFFDRNIFYDLFAKKQVIGLERGGISIRRDDAQRQALEFVQRVRNEYLSVCANGTGGLEAYSGADPMPKALLRAAAQVVAGAEVGEWYDTKRGLDELDTQLRERRLKGAEWKSLFDKISIRRGARGRRKDLTNHEQLLLAELLFDYVESAANPETMIDWNIRFSGASTSETEISKIFQSLLRIVPDAKLLGPSSGSEVLTIRSSLNGQQLVAKLCELQVLARLLDVQTAAVGPTEKFDRDRDIQEDGDPRVAALLARISTWRPEAPPGPATERQFGSYIEQILAEEPALKGTQTLRNPPFLGVDVPFEIDFLLSWPTDDGTTQRLGIEFVWLRSSSIFFYKVSQVLPLGRTVILVIYGAADMFVKLKADMTRLEQMNRNIRIIRIPEVSLQ
jgi:hypothetical protein